MQNDDKILVGKIVAPQGIRGEVRVQTYTAAPDDFKKLAVFGNRIKPGDLRFVRLLNPTSSVVVARIAGIDDRTAAETLRGTELFITRADLPALAEGEYYQTDLIGFDVLRDGEKIGVVAGFQNFGAGDIIELDSGDFVSFAGADVDTANHIINIR